MASSMLGSLVSLSLALSPACGLGVSRFAAPPDARGMLIRDADLDEDVERLESLGPEMHQPSAREIANISAASKLCESQGERQNGVVIFLCTRPGDLVRLKESLPRLNYNLLRQWQYPVRVFVPSEKLRDYDNASFGSSPSKEKVEGVMRSYAGLSDDYDISVESFDLEFPLAISKDSEWRTKMNGCAQAVSTSYKHMNQFFTKTMYEHPSLERFRYYLRVDADFNFLKVMKTDPFCMMAKTGRKFMWQTRKVTHDPRCVEGLWEWFEEYAQKHNLAAKDPVFFKPKGAMVNYVGYAGMGDLDFFRSEPVRKIAHSLNSDGRVYLNRWSDQTYYPLLFALFANHSAVGDIGFQWPEDTWCHKCEIPSEPFNPHTGKIGDA